MGDIKPTPPDREATFADDWYARDQAKRLVLQWFETLSPEAKGHLSENDREALAAKLSERLQDAAKGKR